MRSMTVSVAFHIFLAATFHLVAAPEPAADAARPRLLAWPGHAISAGPLDERSKYSVVEDADAQSVREIEVDGKATRRNAALMVRTDRRSMAKGDLLVARTPLVPWDQLERGVYRVSARVSFDGDVGLIGTPIELSISNAVVDARSKKAQPVKSGQASSELQGLDVDEPGRYYEISLLYEVNPGRQGEHGRLPARNSRSAYRWYYWPYQDAYPEYVPPAPAKGKAPQRSAGVMISLGLPQTKYSATSGMPPNSLRSVRLDWIKLEKVDPSPGITVRYVRAAKVWMRPGMENAFEVYLENFTDRLQQGELTVRLERGLDQKTELRRVPVKLEARAATTVTVPWKTNGGTPWWGYEVIAEVSSQGAVASGARDFFSVHPRVYSVLVKGGRSRRVDPFRQTEGYVNLREDFGILPGDMAQVCPPDGEEQWTLHMGGSAIAQSYPLCRAAIAYNHSQGVASAVYMWSGGTGHYVMDTYVKRPEWLAGRVMATDQVYKKLKDRSDAVRAHDFSKGRPPAMATVPHVQQMLNHWDPVLHKKILDETLVFLRNTGYDAIRFDEGLFPPRSPRTPFGEPLPLPFDWNDRMQVAMRQWEEFRQAVRAEFPHMEFGGNRESYEYISRVGIPGRESPAPESYPEFVAFMRAGGMIMDEPTMEIPSFGHAMNRFDDCLYAMCRKREMCRRFGGLYQLFSPGRDGSGHFAHDDIYFAAMIVTSGSLYVGGFSAPPYGEGNIAAFITRYSEFFRSQDLKPFDDPENVIEVDADDELWFADAAVWADVGPVRRYVIPLLNPPVVDRFRFNKSNEFPRPVEAFDVEVRVPDGFRTAEAWMLTWEPDVGHERLPCEVKRGKARIEFPGVGLCRTLVVEFAK